ncbi:hypothetical protein SSCG_01676 [Streptomyces clavuligerus]|nr:hypothetical protein SSCG_01676 [Streptomyces clavuligerus]
MEPTAPATEGFSPLRHAAAPRGWRRRAARGDAERGALNQ